jgi:hypothetical protein
MNKIFIKIQQFFNLIADAFTHFRLIFSKIDEKKMFPLEKKRAYKQIMHATTNN